MTILEKGEYLLGKKKFPRKLGHVTRTNDLVTCMASYFKTIFPEIEPNIAEINSPNIFYTFCPQCIKYPIMHEKTGQEIFRLEGGVLYTNVDEGEIDHGSFYDEVFYCLKVANPTTVLSAKQQFFIESYAKQFDRDMSWFTKVYPEELFEELCSDGYLPNEYTPHQVIVSLLNLDFDVLTDIQPCVKGPTGYRLYVPVEDAVAKIPDELNDRLSYDDMLNVKFDGTYLTLSGSPLHSYIEGCQGVYLTGNSFDLISCL